MIKVNYGDLLSVTNGIIIHGVNAQGVFGSGVALAIQKKYPKAYEEYKADYRFFNLVLGYNSKQWIRDNDFCIISAVTQKYYGRDGKRYVNYVAIAECFKEAVDYAKDYKLPLHFPKIGAGLGGGDWSIIEQIINDADPYDKVKKNLWILPSA